MTLANKTAIVTGSTSGIGLGIARALAAEGANVMLNGFGDAAAIEQIRREIGAGGSGKVGYHPADMSKPAEIADLVAKTAETLGSVDVVVNNAGIQHVAPVENFPVDRWDAIIAINLSSSFHTIRAALPLMKKAGWGRIINIASTHGLVASGEKTAYVAAKHGVIGLTKSVAIECANTGVTCNAICPGWVLTPLVQKQIEARAAEQKISVEQARNALLGEKQPQLQFTTPEQLAAMAVFLCSPAAANMQGTQLVSDGGWTAQ
ncbi:3-hydroxybutyrate dehydrogenase [Reyranella sp. CPCC 100927]|uniref:3-hydroxybutyrate dehydrogenase n=1 Tax=Reyranella sp. CPCC 100927 TaxID=2599616 RepID=UPI0011B5368F|nr:3-hydroxybutyrate dehydrogenase [Reyranella sp. CPCC 100927]TWT02054.1 3-hydroxybutyrate dehydrogenase [Reyranella sp. CPCC 100927]